MSSGGGSSQPVGSQTTTQTPQGSGNAEADAAAAAAKAEAAKKEKSYGSSQEGTILSSGAGVLDEAQTKKNTLG